MPEKLQEKTKVERGQADQVIWDPNETQKEIVKKIKEEFDKAKTQRDLNYYFFGGRDLKTYIDDSEKRFNGYVEARTNEEDWQSRVFKQETRNRTIAILAKIAAQRVKTELFPQETQDLENIRRAKILQLLYDASEEKDGEGDRDFLFSALETAVKGTCVKYEGYKIARRKVREVLEYDPDTGKLDYQEKEIKDWDDCYTEILPLEDFYPANIFQKDVQKQPQVFWRSLSPWSDFQREFEKYKNSQYVKKAGLILEIAPTFYSGNISSDVSGEQVEVIRYFNKWTDEFHILANGILLTETESPFPWNHKNYPFIVSIFEPFSNRFFYGKSLPDKLMSDQDTINALWNMMLDQTYLSLHRPILTSDLDEIEDDLLVPGRRYPVQNVANWKELGITPPTSSQFSIIQLVSKSMDMASLSEVRIEPGARTTATEITQAKEAALELLSLFLRFMEWMVRDKTILKLSNILQFYTVPKASKVSENAAEELTASFSAFRLENVQLSDRTQGTRVLKMFGSKEELPTKSELDREEMVAKQFGENVQVTAITIDYFRDFQYGIKIVPNSSVKISEGLTRALGLEFYKLALANPIVNQRENMKYLAELYDRDPEKMLLPPEMTPGAPPVTERGIRRVRKETSSPRLAKEITGSRLQTPTLKQISTGERQ